MERSASRWSWACTASSKPDGNSKAEPAFDRIAGELDFIMVYPDNYTGDWDIIPRTKTVNDDLGYIGALIDELKKRYAIDPARVYVTGHSDGAFMAYRAAYDLSDRITAVAPFAGLVYTPIVAIIRRILFPCCTFMLSTIGWSRLISTIRTRIPFE